MSSEMHEMIRRFHNQKELEYNHYDARDKNNEYVRTIERDKEVGESSTLEDIISETVLKINNIYLNEQSKNDTEQIELLDKKRRAALNKIKGLLDDVRNYVLSISAMDTIKVQREELEQKNYLIQFERADEARRRSHDLLMSDMQSVISYIQYNFGIINEKALDKWEEEQDEKGETLLDVQRMPFSPKVICPENLNLTDRKQITSWAVQLALSIGNLKKKLSP